MPKFKNIENRKNITYKLACNEGKLISKDKKILNLAKKIKKDASVVKELKKLDKIEEILMVEIVRKCEGRKERLTLLQQALLYSHKSTLEYVMKGAEEYKLFEKISGKRIEVLLPKEKMVPTRRLIKVDRSLLNEEDIDNLNPTTTEHTKEKAMSTRRLIKVDRSLLNEEDIDNLNPTTTEHTKEKAMSTRRLIKVDRSLLDNEDNENFHLTFENSKKAQNSSIKTAVQERDIFGSFPFQQSFNGDSAGKEETPSKKAMQQKQAIVAGSAGIVLLVGSIVSYILKMHIIAVVVGIVGLACISFALYSNLKPNTKLEKLEGPAQPVIVHSHLNPT